MTVDKNRASQTLMSIFAAKLAKWRKAASPAPTGPDPYLGAKAAGREIYTLVRASLGDAARPPHPSSLLCALGALAGHACQASVSAQSVAAGKAPGAPFWVIEGNDGRSYLAGDAMNGLLADDKMSVWNLAAAAARHHGSRDLPDRVEMFAHHASLVGTSEFGVPRLPAEHAVDRLPIEFAKRLWPSAQAAVMKLGANPKLWPIAAGIAIQEAIAHTRYAVAPDVAVRIVMECAIPVSKIPIER